MATGKLLPSYKLEPQIIVDNDTDKSTTWGNGTTVFCRDTNKFYILDQKTFTDIVSSTGATKALNNLASVAVNTSLISDTDDTDDLGSSSKEWKDLYVDGIAYLDSIDFNGTAITSTGTQLNYLSLATGTTGSGSLVFGTSPILSTSLEVNGKVYFGRAAYTYRDTIPDFYWDNTNYKLKVRGILIADVGDTPDLALRRSGPEGGNYNDVPTAMGSGENIGKIYFQAYGTNLDFDVSGGSGVTAEIYAQTAEVPTGTARGGNLHFQTCAIGAKDPTTRLSILSTGNVGIATDVPDAKLEIKDGSASGKYLLQVYNTSTGGDTDQTVLIRGGGNNAASHFLVQDYDGNTDFCVYGTGEVGIGIAPTAMLHLKAGTATASTAPLKFTSGTLLGTPEVGAVEFLTDAFYGTITTGAARKTFAFLESPSFTTPTIGVATATSIAIGANTLDTNEWAYLDGQNQAVASTSSPTFANITDSGLTASKVVFTDGSKVLTSTGIGTSSQFIKGDGSLDSTTYLSSVTAHNLLSATHGDTTASTVARGDIIIGSGASPKWDNLAVGASGTYLAGGTEPSWATLNQAAVAGLTTASTPTFAGLITTGDIYTAAWTDYSATSTITGWSSFTTKLIFYKKVGKLVYVEFNLAGTSDSTSTSFTLPYTKVNSGSYALSPVSARDNGNNLTTPAMAFVNTNSSTANIYKDWSMAGTAWTASNEKVCWGSIIFEATA